MIKTFTFEQQKAIQEKVGQLKKIMDGTLKPYELAGLITKRRLDWLEENRNLWGEHDLSLEDAYKLLIYYHMKIEEGILINKNGKLLEIECKNFCPYLEACKELNLDTRFVCKEINEPSLRAFFQKINPNIHFSRDYNKIRPYSDCCLESLEEK